MQQLNYATFKSGEKITLKQDVGETYDILKKEIGGTFDVVSVIEDLDIWVDDEGFLKGLEPTLIIKNSKEPALTDIDILITGPVVFASYDEEGRTISLTDKALEQLKKFKPALLGYNLVMVYENF